jgi:outer membrane protein TolC
VLLSVQSRYPPLLAALLERDIAAGRRLSAQGAFDLSVNLKAKAQALGFYRYTYTDVGLEQPTTLYGATLFADYDVLTDKLPDYYKDIRTNTGGRFSGGVRLPLLAGGAIDRRRAGLRQTEIDLDLADPFIARTRLDFLRAAARAYFTWVAAGRRLAVAEDLLRIARERNAAIERRVERGDLPEIELADNRRLIVNRQLGVVRAERALQQAAIELSLFHRDAADNPLVVGRGRLPGDFPPVDPPDTALAGRLAELALSARPELRRFKLLADKTQVDLDLAENQLLPNLDVTLAAGQNVDGKPYKDRAPFGLEVGVEGKVPLQRREARGRLEAARAAMERIRTDERFARDRITAEVQDALSAVRQAALLIAQTRENTRLARVVETAERRAFDAGRSTILNVNLRETATADAAVLEIDALADYFRALADLRAALAIGAEGPETPTPPDLPPGIGDANGIINRPADAAPPVPAPAGPGAPPGPPGPPAPQPVAPPGPPAPAQP